MSRFSGRSSLFACHASESIVAPNARRPVVHSATMLQMFCRNAGLSNLWRDLGKAVHQAEKIDCARASW